MKVKPRVFVPTLYFAEGLPYTIVNQMSVVFYTDLGATNTYIGLATSFLYLPWTLKFLWSPLVDVYGTKKRWIVVSQMVLAAFSILVAASTILPHGLYVSAVVFMLMAIASATHDIAIDGYYMDALSIEQQALYVGVRNAFYKVAWLLGSGGLVFLAGTLAEKTSLGVSGGWLGAFLACTVLLGLCALFHKIALPEPERLEEVGQHEKKSLDFPASDSSEGERARLSTKEFLSVFLDWLEQPGIVAIVIYILIFRAGDALMLKMAQPFLLRPTSEGGLGISTADVGILYGTIGVAFLLVGGLFGGWLVSRFGLKKCLLPTALIQNLAILLYFWLASSRPSGHAFLFGFDLSAWSQSIGVAPEFQKWFEGNLFYTLLVNSAEQFSYGLGTAAYTVFLLTTVKSSYKAAHYAIATAIMALGLMLPGAISGYLADSLGYAHFFLISFLVSIPGLLTIFWLPLTRSDFGKTEVERS